MPHVQRNRQGEIVSLHRDPQPGAVFLPAEHPEVQAFVGHPPGVARAAAFATLDAEFIRVIEDVVDVLVARNIIRITDLPGDAQHKLFERKSLREGLKRNALQLYADLPAVLDIEMDAGVVPTDTLASPLMDHASLTRLVGLKGGDEDVL
ncbi:MAG: hypothetical protein RLZZ584_1582 [Pseudomonadota bacterium]|jgi:hypothetical protein